MLETVANLINRLATVSSKLQTQRGRSPTVSQKTEAPKQTSVTVVKKMNQNRPVHAHLLSPKSLVLYFLATVTDFLYFFNTLFILFYTFYTFAIGFPTFMKNRRQLQEKQRQLQNHKTVNKSIKYRANIGHSIRAIHRALHRAIHRESIGQGELPDGLLEEGG